MIFSFELETFGVAVQRIHQNSKKDGFCEELLSENDFEAVLANFCCYDYGGNASEAVHKIATDQKDYRKCSLCVIVLLNGQNISINNSEKRLVSRTPPT